MNTIVAEIIKIIKKSEDAISREEQIWHYIVAKMAQYVGTAFEAIDEELAKAYSKKDYRVERRDSRTIQGIFGAVTIRRRRMQAPDGKGMHPLDRELGIVPYQRYTPYFQHCVAQIAAKSVYRSTAMALTLLTPVTISHQEVGSLIKKVGEQYAKWEDAQACAEPEDEAVLKTPEVLYIEGDGVIIRGQKQKKIELHRFQIAEGVKVNGKRRELTGTYCFAGFNRSKTMNQVKQYLEKNYDLSKTIVISNSDGGAGYSESVFTDITEGCKRHEHFRDRYHVNKKIKERLNFTEKALVNKLHRCLWDYDREGVSVVLDTVESVAEGKEQETQVSQLRKYLERNWAYLRPIEQRGGIDGYKKGIDTCESNHRLYTYRMKKQGRRWGKTGGEAMLKIITGLRNKNLARALTEQDKRFNKKQSRRFNGAVRMALKKTAFVEHVGIKHGRIVNYSPTSSAIGHLAKAFA